VLDQLRGAVGNEKAIDFLFGLVQNEKDKKCRLHAVESFGLVGIKKDDQFKEKVNDFFSTLLVKENSRPLKVVCLGCIGEMKFATDKIENAIANILDSETDSELRLKAIEVLNSLNINSLSHEFLVEALTKNVNPLKPKLSGFSKLENTLRRKFSSEHDEEKESKLRVLCAQVIGNLQIRGEGVADCLSKALELDHSPAVRAKCAQVLGNMHVTHAVALKSLLKACESDSDKDVRKFAALGIGKTKILSQTDEENVRSVILNCIKKETDENVRGSFYEALGMLKFSGEDVLVALESATNNEKTDKIKKNASEAVNRIRSATKK